MTPTLHPTAAAYVRATNDHDHAAFMACFADNAVVNDNGREFRGPAAIENWSRLEIMDAKVTLDVLDVRAGREGDKEVTIVTKVDGNFDRTGLPDPLIICHAIVLEGDKIVRLACRLESDRRDSAVGKPAKP